MQPQYDPIEDLTQPRTVNGPMNRVNRYFTESITGSGPLGTRFDISQSQPIWKQNEFKIYVEEPGGTKKLADESNFREYPRAVSETGESDTSSVIPVDDLGLGAAPAKSLDTFREFYYCWEKNISAPRIEHVMFLGELRRHLGSTGREPDTIEKLISDKMQTSFERSKRDNQLYLPLDAFETIFDIETIKSLIKEAYPTWKESKWREMVARIVGTKPNEGYRRILGVLVLMGRVSSISEFIEEVIPDSDLPIRRSQSDDQEFETRKGVYTLFRSWHMNFIELFYVYQKRLFIPFFDIQENQLCSYEFNADIILPWKHYTRKTNGGNGLVHKVQIHPDHHNFKTPSDPKKPLCFALKEISAVDRDTYRRELWALQKTTSQTQKEKHLIKLLLTFEHGDKCYLLFEWANGNLEEFWEQSDISPAPSDTWAVQQCLGISNAIKRIHGLATWQVARRSYLGSESDDERGWGRHGDIKPNNILWFSEYGNDPQNILHHHLVVSDLGLTRYHSRATRSAVPWLHIEGYTWTYRPPEMDTEHLISQKYDIWSLGCVFLEFCVWYVNGGDAVEVFRAGRIDQDKSEIEELEEDKYFNITTDDQGGKRASLKPIIEEYISRLRIADKSTPFINKMLNLIQDGMLVVDSKERWKIDQVCTEIDQIRRSLKPTTDSRHTVEDTVANHDEVSSRAELRYRSTDRPRVQIASEDRPSVEENSVSQTNTLVNFAQGDFGDALADSSRRRSLSIRSEQSDSETVQGSQNATELASDKPKEDGEAHDKDSHERQTTFNTRSNSTLPKLPFIKTNPHTAPRPKSGQLIQDVVGNVEAFETRESKCVTLIHADLMGGDSEQRWRQHFKIRVLQPWVLLRKKVEGYAQRSIHSREQTRRTNKSKTI
ncbi:kinase-like domain-containing protein [Hypoxylon sp. FL1150]|nr:kinase-like domain-containing protein [Hypoxylon sp. FL1150]